MTIAGTSALPEFVGKALPVEPTEEAVASAPHNPTVDGTAEGGPPRGGMEEIWRARKPAGPPGQETFAARKGLGEVKTAVRESVREALESGELSEDEAEALKDAASELRHELQEARQSIVPGDAATGEAAYDLVSEAVQDFFGELDEIAGDDDDDDIAVVEVDDDDSVDLDDDDDDDDAGVSTVDVASEVVTSGSTFVDDVLADVDLTLDAVDETLSEIVDVVDDTGSADQDASDTGPFDSIKDALTAALDGFWDALNNPTEASDRFHPFASFYEAVGSVSDPTSEEAVSTAVLA